MNDIELGAAIQSIVQRELQNNQTIVQLAQHAQSMALVVNLLLEHLNCKDEIMARLQKLAESSNAASSAPAVPAANND